MTCSTLLQWQFQQCWVTLACSWSPEAVQQCRCRVSKGGFSLFSIPVCCFAVHWNNPEITYHWIYRSPARTAVWELGRIHAAITTRELHASTTSSDTSPEVNTLLSEMPLPRRFKKYCLGAFTHTHKKATHHMKETVSYFGSGKCV